MSAILFGCLLFAGLSIVNELNRSARDKHHATARVARLALAPATAATAAGLTQRWRDADRRAS